jgi:hypothetical protein
MQVEIDVLGMELSQQLEQASQGPPETIALACSSSVRNPAVMRALPPPTAMTETRRWTKSAASLHSITSSAATSI